MERTATLSQPLALSSKAAEFFKATGRFLVWLSEANPRMAALTRLSETSDEALSARGLTRDGEVRRIMGPRFYA